MKPIKAALLLAGLSLTWISTAMAQGYSTRDLNPILQPILIPSLFHVAEDGWRIDHSLFITNTDQREERRGETLVIDVENTRYELDLGYRRDHWVYHANVPLMANRSGELDGLIEDWHDFFGLPQGTRPDAPRDQLEIAYTRNGTVEYSQTDDSDGLADIMLAIGYQPLDDWGYFAAIELPTGSESDFSGNEGVDLAFWTTRVTAFDDETNGFLLFGVSFPADDGALEGLVVDQIWVAQAGLDYRFTTSIVGTVQVDLHSSSVKSSGLKAFGESLQIQLGLGFSDLFWGQRLDLFFSEDILVGSAPDISMGARLSSAF